jgi:hypothetical protein
MRRGSLAVIATTPRAQLPWNRGSITSLSDGSWAYSLLTGDYFLEHKTKGFKMTNHLHLLTRLRMPAVISPLSVSSHCMGVKHRGRIRK